jgi:hypothetical protein
LDATGDDKGFEEKASGTARMRKEGKPALAGRNVGMEWIEKRWKVD